jgi:hypothetical protein
MATVWPLRRGHGEPNRGTKAPGIRPVLRVPASGGANMERNPGRRPTNVSHLSMRRATVVVRVGGGTGPLRGTKILHTIGRPLGLLERVNADSDPAPRGRAGRGPARRTRSRRDQAFSEWEASGRCWEPSRLIGTRRSTCDASIQLRASPRRLTQEHELPQRHAQCAPRPAGPNHRPQGATFSDGRGWGAVAAAC